MCVWGGGGWGGAKRWKLSKPLYGLTTSCKEWYLKIGDFLVNLGWVVALLDKAVFFWGSDDCFTVPEKVGSANALNNERGVFEINEDSGPEEKRNAVGISIPHVGDLLIARTGDVISFLSGKLEGAFGTKAFVGGDSIYLRTEIANVPNKFNEDGGYLRWR